MVYRPTPTFFNTNMKYKLIDLGPPKNPIFCSAFVVTPKDNFLVKGSQVAVDVALKSPEFPPFFGRLVTYNAAKQYGSPTYLLISKGLHLSYKVDNDRGYYYFYSGNGVNAKQVFFAKTRRFPHKWLQEIEPDLASHLKEVSEYLVDKGFVIAANFIKANLYKLAYDGYQEQRDSTRRHAKTRITPKP